MRVQILGGALPKKPHRTMPFIGNEGPFLPLTTSNRLGGEYHVIEDPHELFLIRRQDENNSTLSDLILACRCGDRLVVEQQLSAHADVNSNEGGTTALIESLAHEHFEIAKLLLTNGADVRAADKSQWSALHLIA